MFEFVQKSRFSMEYPFGALLPKPPTNPKQTNGGAGVSVSSTPQYNTTEQHL